MAKEEVVVHGVGDNLGDAVVGKLEEGVVLAAAGLFVARETETRDFAKLREVGFHFVFVEAVGDALEDDYAALVGFLGGGVSMGF